MVVWRMRNCPRCGGDIFLDIDGATYYDHCLQCGYARRRAKECCPRCGDDMFLDIAGGNWFYRCYQCGYSKERHASISQEDQHGIYLVTSGGAMTAGWATRKPTDKKPGRPKGSKDKKKRRKRRSALN